MEYYCKQCGCKLRKQKIKQKGLVKRVFENAGIPTEDNEYYCPKCYDEGW